MAEPVIHFWSESTAPELNRRLTAESIFIIPIGSTEQHGPHLTTGVDSALALAVSARVAIELDAKSIQAVVAPVLPYGLAEHHMSLGGTITLDEETFKSVIKCIVKSAARQGYRRFVLLNGHGGNMFAISSTAASLCEELDLPVIGATYWFAAAAEFQSILTKQTNVLHACEAETSMMLSVAPNLVRHDQIEKSIPSEGPVYPKDLPGISHRRPFKYFTSTGVLGDPRAATPEKGEALLDAAGKAIAGSLAHSDLWLR